MGITHSSAVFVTQCLRCGTKHTQVAAHTNKGSAHFDVAASVRFDGGQNASRLAAGLGIGKDRCNGLLFSSFLC